MASQLITLVQRTINASSARVKGSQPLAGYKAVDHDSEDEHDAESAEKLLKCSQCDKIPSPTQRSRDSRALFVMYGGWGLSLVLAVMIAVLIWLDERNMKRNCFKETAAYCRCMLRVILYLG